MIINLLKIIILTLLILTASNVNAEMLIIDFSGWKIEVAQTDLDGEYNWEEAKLACKNLVTSDGKKDWFLPTRGILTAMHSQLWEKGLGGLGNWNNDDKCEHAYMSSSIVANIPNAVFANFFSRKRFSVDKNNKVLYNGELTVSKTSNKDRVRCVRIFKSK